ncbi:MAG: hypothetical protein HYY40_00460 [Bacteroidetes bacterium]|nr:hypothetical protein [Bacteroidota bacterium]
MLYRHYHTTHQEYYSRFIFPNDPDYFRGLLQRAGECPLTSCEIKFRNLHFGTGKKEITREIGKPRFEIERGSQGFKYHILFYKDNIKNIRFLLQLHLINDEFFFGCNTFKNLEYTKFGLVKSALFQKYTDIVNTGAGTQHSLADGRGNLIYFEENVLLRICYITGDKNILKTLSGYIDECRKRSKKESDFMQESLMKLL